MRAFVLLCHINQRWTQGLKRRFLTAGQLDYGEFIQVFTSGMFKFRASTQILAEIQRKAPELIMQRAMAGVWFEGVNNGSAEMRAQGARLKVFLARCMRGELAMRLYVWKGAHEEFRWEKAKHEGALLAKVGITLMQSMKGETGMRVHIWATRCREEKSQRSASQVRGYQVMYMRQVILNRVGNILRDRNAVNTVRDRAESKEDLEMQIATLQKERKAGGIRTVVRTFARIMRGDISACIEAWRMSLQQDKEKALKKILSFYLRMQPRSPG
jgi:hypothetical protein